VTFILTLLENFPTTSFAPPPPIPSSPCLSDLEVWSFIFIPLITYGFWGMEMISVELADPFGDDDNDLDIQGCVDDTFATIADMYDLPKPRSVVLAEAFGKEEEEVSLNAGGAPTLYQLI